MFRHHGHLNTWALRDGALELPFRILASGAPKIVRHIGPNLVLVTILAQHPYTTRGAFAHFGCMFATFPAPGSDMTPSGMLLSGGLLWGP